MNQRTRNRLESALWDDRRRAQAGNGADAWSWDVADAMETIDRIIGKPAKHQHINVHKERVAANAFGWVLGILAWGFLVTGIITRERKWIWASIVTFAQGVVIGAYERVLDEQIEAEQ